MELPFRHPDTGRSSDFAEIGTECLEDVEPEQVSITLDADCLCRLLRERQLYIQDFSCVDYASRACVRRLLLALLSPTG